MKNKITKKERRVTLFFLFKIKIEAIRSASRNQTQPSMNFIQELQVPSPSTPFAPRFVCPPIPRASEVSSPLTFPSASSPTNVTAFSWGARPTWTLPPPQNRSGANAPTGDEPTLSWSDLVLPTEPESLRHLTLWMQPAILPSQQADDIIHPDIGHILIRQRGSYWWEKSQAMLEQQFSSGQRQPVQGGFYVFLEEEQSGNIVRFGNVLMNACWRMQTVAFPKGHPDADVPPYQMIDVRQ
jgi:hypothetical protein